MNQTLLRISVLFLLHSALFTSYQRTYGQTMAMARQLSKSQPASATLTVRQLQDVLNELKGKYQVGILFEDRTITGLTVPADVLSGSTSLSVSLERLLKPFDLRYKQVKPGTWIILNRKEDRQLVPANGESHFQEKSDPDLSSSQQEKNTENAGATVKPFVNQPLQEITVRGRVSDAETKEGLPGVSVVVKETSRGTSTDANGNYQIAVPTQSAVLVFSYVGYDRQESTVGNQTNLNVSLKAAAGSLAEVVVVGYGQQKKANLTGSVATIESKELLQSPAADVSNSVAGRVAGLITKQPSGEPGADGSTLLIRGISTSGDNTPLYVIDGIPRQPSDLSQLNPNEIETFTILKDAASSAVFGVRGANGVVLVTTKRGKAGKTGFSYSANFGLQQPTRLPEFLGSYDYAVLYNEAKRNEGKPELYTADDLQKFKDGSDPDRHPNTDWYKAVLKPLAPQTQHNLSVNGGGEKTRYQISLGYLNQKGLYESINFKRYNIRANIDADVTKTTTISLDLSGRVEDRNTPGQTSDQIFAALIGVPSVYAPRYQNGLLTPGGGGGGNVLANLLGSGYRNNNRTVLLSRLVATQQLPFIPGLAVRGIVAVDKSFIFNKRWTTTPEGYQLLADNTYEPNPVGAPSLAESFYQYQSITSEAHLIYNRSFGKHDLNGLLLYTQNVTDDNTLTGYRNNFPTSAVEQVSAGDAKNQQTTGTATRTTRQGYVGRLNYAFAGRYIFEANFRYDGSDNFAPGKRFGFFPSVSAGWVLTEENFLKGKFNALDFLKIRASYGKLGNDRLRDASGNDIRRYPYLSTYSYGNDYVFGGSSPAVVKGINEGGLINASTTWETATKTDIGLEARLWRGLISLEATYFYQRRAGILGTRSIGIPDLVGAALAVENIGTIDNKGFELALGHQNKINQFSYFVRGNATFVRNKIIFIDEPTSTNPLRQLTGYALNQFVGLEATGLFQSAEEIKSAPAQFGNTNLQPGDIRYRDVNGDGKIDNDDRTRIGRSNIPQIIYGLSLGFSYRGFDVNALLQGAGQVNQYLSEEAAWAFFNGGTVMKQHLDRWTPTNPNATYPRILTEDNNNRIVSSYWLKNASYLRLKNVEIGYTVPKAIVGKIRAESLRIYANGLNLFTISQIKTFDPENTNARAWAYPQQKIFNFGLTIQF